MKQFSEYTKIEINKIFKDYLKSGKNNLLLTGGVGVGKTLYAKILSNMVICQNCISCENPVLNSNINNGYVHFFSFGAHYNHENFIYGLRISCENGNLKFEERKKRFLDLCDKASEDSDHNYVAIFDDINRADISQTLGDMLSALESKDVGNEIHAGQDRVELPDNLYIIATANPLVGKEKLDYAWMRRFMHYNILPDERHFGFDFDGSDIGDGYRQYVDKAWQKVDFYDEKNGVGSKKENQEIEYDEENGVGSKKENQEIEYDDTAGKINDVGIAFLRQYQWEIFMHVKIMYERYFYDPNDKVRRDQYIPGHGMFLTYFKNKSYGYNLAFFQNVLRFQVVPLLRKYMDDGILTGDAILDIEAIADVAGEEIKKKINSGEVSSEAKGKSPNAKNETKLRELIKNYEKIKWSEWYLFIACNLYLRRIDRRSTPKLSNIHITRSTIWCYLIEREFSIGKYFSGKRGKKGEKGEKDILLPCHNKNQFFLIDNVKLLFPQQVTKGREYVLLEKKPQYVEWDKITEILSKTIAEINERKRKMSNIDDKNKYINIMNDLSIKQMILQGPPGTSKTYGAKYDIIAPAFGAGERDDEKKKKELLSKYQIKDYVNHKENFGWDMVQFHPSYSYEDFVRGITVSTKNDKVVYETVNKILGKMCKLAADHSKGKFFLIIDEINRADVATVFGELIYALECRGEEVSIPYGIEERNEDREGKNETNYKLVIPDNLYIIGTMNTADKSIGTIDYAIRRRFLFFDCLPNEDVVEKYNIQTGGETQKDINSDAIKMMKNLRKFIDGTINKGYHKKDFYIGHTYFLVKNEEELMLRLKYQIVPILREYYENGVLINDLNKTEEIKTRYPKLIEAIKGKDQSYDSQSDDSQSDDSLFDALYKEIIE